MRGRRAQVIDVQQLTKKLIVKSFVIARLPGGKTYLHVFELIAKKCEFTLQALFTMLLYTYDRN